MINQVPGSRRDRLDMVDTSPGAFDGIDADAFASPVYNKPLFSPEAGGTAPPLGYPQGPSEFSVGITADPGQLRRQKFLEAQRALDQQDQVEKNEKEAHIE